MTKATPRPKQHFRAKISAAAQAAGGELRGPDAEVTAVTTDSRDVPANGLFVALVGETFDGHDFVQTAADAGAAAAMTSKETDVEIATIRVDDTLVGLGALARWYRDQFEIPVVALTGSAGKTTTKEMAAAALSARFNVHKTTGNLNNRIGVPLTLFGLSKEHGAAVIEAGINQPGEMDQLAHIIAPSIGVVLNATTAHVEYLGDAAGVAHEKAKLFDAADTIVFNAEDPLVAAEAAKRSGTKLSFGDTGDVTAEDVHGCAFTIVHGGQRQAVTVDAVGAHNVKNALAAAAIAIAAGLTLAEIARGLKTYTPMKGRSHASELASGALLIDDTYNSNPASAKAALQMLRDVGRGRTIAVLADMLELGSAGEQAHAAVGQDAGGIDVVLAFGPLSKHTADAARAAGVPLVEHFDDRAACGARAAEILKATDAVLVKGSRGMKMEEVVAAIREKHA